MNSKSQFLVVASLGVVAIALILAKGRWWKDAAPGVDPAAVARIQERLLELERSQRATQSTLDEIARSVRATERGATSSSAGDASAIAGASSESGRMGEAAAKAASRPASEAMTLASAMAQLNDPSMSWDDREEIWKKVRAAGLLDQVIAEFEKHAAANPKDPKAQTALGTAYLKKTEEAGNGPEAGKWATKADQAFDDALEIDPEHWDARYVKAVALSFWPPVFGKQTEAIKHFETLLGQQERQQPRDGFDSTYLMLGNMYQQLGQRDQAVATWQRGLKVFPDNADLRQQIANAR